MVPSYGTGGTFNAPNANPQRPLMNGGGGNDWGALIQQLMQNPQLLQSIMPQMGQMNQPSPMGIGQGARSSLSPFGQQGMQSLQPNNIARFPEQGKDIFHGGNIGAPSWKSGGINPGGHTMPSAPPAVMMGPGGQQMQAGATGGWSPIQSGITRSGSGAFQGGQQIGHYGNNNELIRNSGMTSMAPSNMQQPANPIRKPMGI